MHWTGCVGVGWSVIATGGAGGSTGNPGAARNKRSRRIARISWTRWTGCVWYFYFSPNLSVVIFGCVHFWVRPFLGASIFGTLLQILHTKVAVLSTFPRLNIMFACLQCGKQFGTDNARRQHMRSTGHTESYKCTRCNEQFETEKDLQRHERYKHEVVTCPNLQCRCVVGTLSHLQSTHGN